MYLEYYSDGHFEAATGTLQCERSDEIVRFESLMWIGDTRDGGASSLVTHVDGRELKRWTRKAESSEESSAHKFRTQVHSDQGEAVPAHCHCRGIEFWITPPSPISLDHKTAKSPFPDLLIPHHLNHERAHNPDNMSWWSPNGTRWRAGTCACASCRKACGFDITFWAFVPTANIFLDDTCTKRFPGGGEYWGTMKTYASSKGVTRTFCKTYGANVFWNGDEKNFGRRGLVDVAVGLLDARSGARAEEVLDWWCRRVSFAEDGMHKGLVEGLELGMRDWELRRIEGNDDVPCQ